jgi:hypothetical protein
MNQPDEESPPLLYDVVWEQDYLEGGGHMGVAIDSLNNIVVCGISKDEESGVVVKYDADGRELWSDHDFPAILNLHRENYGEGRLRVPPTISQTLGTDYGYFFDVAIDNDNNIIVVGTFITESGLHSSIFIKKYRPDGTTLWERTYTPFVINLATSVAVDQNNDIFIAGGGSVGVQIFKAFVMKLNGTNGRRRWRRTHAVGDVALYNDLTISDDQSVFTAGFVSNGTRINLVLASYGCLIGRRRKTYIGDEAVATSITLVSQERLIVAGKTEKDKDNQYLFSCTPKFEQQWSISDEISGFLYGTAILKNTFIAATGACYALNRYYVGLFRVDNGRHHMDLDLGSRVSGRLDDYLRGITMNADGDMVVAGARTVGRTMKILLQEATPTPPSPTPQKLPDYTPPHDSLLARLLHWLSDLF